MKHKIIGVLGLGIFGQTVAYDLSKFDQEVIACDKSKDNVQAVSEYATKAAIGDIADLDFLKHIGIADCDCVVIATGNSLEASVLAVMHCKKLGVPKIIAKARNTTYQEVLYEIGADLVISPERESGSSLASQLLRQRITDVFEIESDIKVIEFSVPKDWIGKTIVELDVRRQYNLNLIGLRHSKTDKLHTDLALQQPLQEGDIIVAISNNDTFEKFDYLGYFK
ncbi:potassium channel family protein [Streptococcus sp. zg-JUN1979]|uniref:potassium channel family protein n=1 Tax=Streptococcus sp. zg-JUN1979 TaxID=3391450 RepID=UPI0039A4AD03